MEKREVSPIWNVMSYLSCYFVVWVLDARRKQILGFVVGNLVDLEKKSRVAQNNKKIIRDTIQASHPGESLTHSHMNHSR